MVLYWSARCLETSQRRDTRPKNEIGMNSVRHFCRHSRVEKDRQEWTPTHPSNGTKWNGPPRWIFVIFGRTILPVWPTIMNCFSVLKRCVPKTLAFAFGLRLRSKTRCFKTHVSGSRLPNGKPQERLRFRDLRSKTLAFKKRIAIFFCELKTSLGARACV